MATPEESTKQAHPSAQEQQPHVASTEKTSSSEPPSEEDTKKWGTHVMGAPAAPAVHPDNQRAAQWNAADYQQIYHQPYVRYEPIEKPSGNPFEPVIHMFNSWSRKAETVARNIWHNRKCFELLSIDQLWRKNLFYR